MKSKREKVMAVILIAIIAAIGFYAHGKEEVASKNRNEFLDKVSTYQSKANTLEKQDDLFTETGTYYMAVDERARIIDVSTSFTKELGYEKNDLIGRNLNTLFKKSFQSKHSRKFDKGMQKSKGQYGHYLDGHKDAVLIRKDGTELKLQVALRINPHAGGVAFCWKIE